MNNQLQPLDQRAYYPPPPPTFDGGQIAEAHVSSPDPLRCNMCDSDTGVTRRPMKKDYVPSVGYLLLVLSLLIGLIVILATRVRHKFDLAFCDRCWQRSRNAGRFESLALLGFFLSIVVGIIVMLELDNGLWMSLLGFSGLGALIWSQIYKRKNAPHYKLVDRKQVVVSTASGELVFLS